MSEPAGRERAAAASGRRTRRLSGYTLVLLVTIAVLVVLFVVTEALALPILTDPAPWLDRGGPLAAIAGVGLLVADVAVPTPSSVVMVTHGSLFGVLGGAPLSLLGVTAATLLAFWIGRRTRGVVREHTDPAERGRVGRLVERYGVVAIVATRPLPIMAEAVAVVAGATPMRWRTVLAGAVLGNLAPAFVYAYAGSRAATLADQAIILGVVIVLSLLLLLLGRRLTD